MYRSLVIMFLVVLVSISVFGSIEDFFKKQRTFQPKGPIGRPRPRPRPRPKVPAPALESRGGPVADLREGFKVLDRDGDGYIDIKDITDDINNFFPGQANRNPADIISEADKDGDGRISYEDFIAAAQTGPPSYEER